MKSKLHPGAKWSSRVSSYVAYFILLIFISFYGGVFLLSQGVSLKTIGFILLIVVIALVIWTEIWVRLAYNRWFYEFTQDNLKIEHGVIWKTYKNIPYERIQNVDIRRGIIARMLGFSTVMIQTAGYSGGRGRGAGAEGVLPAVSIKHAEEIRDFVMKKISRKGNKSGL